MSDYFGLVQTQDGGAITGEIRAGLFAIAPYGWLKCDGSTFDKEQYPKLAALLPSGKTPDLREASLSGRNLEALGSVVGSNTMSVPRHTHGVLTSLEYNGSYLPVKETNHENDKEFYSIPRTNAIISIVSDLATSRTPVYTHDTAARLSGNKPEFTTYFKTIEEVGDANADVRGKRCIVNFIIRAI